MDEWDQGGWSYKFAAVIQKDGIYESRSLKNLLGTQSPLKPRGPLPVQMDPNAISILALTILVMKGTAKPGVTGPLNVMSGRVPWIQWFPDLVGWLRASRDGAWQSACLISLQGDTMHCRNLAPVQEVEFRNPSGRPNFLFYSVGQSDCEGLFQLWFFDTLLFSPNFKITWWI